jgi:hypothetical protein
MVVVVGLALVLMGCETAPRARLVPRVPPPGEVCIDVAYFDHLVDAHPGECERQLTDCRGALDRKGPHR